MNTDEQEAIEKLEDIADVLPAALLLAKQGDSHAAEHLVWIIERTAHYARASLKVHVEKASGEAA